MANELPIGTTQPRGLPPPERIHWPLIPSRDLFELRYGKALVESMRRPGAVPVYGTNGQCGSHDEGLFKGPGVILGRKGQGPLGVEWSERDYWVIDTAYSLAPIRSDVDLRFAYFLIKYIGLNHLKDGTSNPTLSRDSFGAQALPLPPLDCQRGIAQILGTLDDKIDLNRRMSETLEAMALALFKSWFVDFDPVRAKAEGRDPGLPQSVADLFPSRFVDSELGEVPDKWEIPRLGEILRESNDRIGDLEAPEYSSTNVGLQLRSERFKKTLAASSEKNKLVRRGFLVFGLSRRVLNFGRMRDEVGSVSSAYKVFRVREESVHADLLERLMRLQANRFYMAVAASSREGQSVSAEGLSLLRFVMPPRGIQQAFYLLDDEFRARNEAIELETRTLTALRDTLLPKMLSGELRLPTADKLVASVV